jgi:hypothetical protein
MTTSMLKAGSEARSLAGFLVAPVAGSAVYGLGFAAWAQSAGSAIFGFWGDGLLAFSLSLIPAALLTGLIAAPIYFVLISRARPTLAVSASVGGLIGALPVGVTLAGILVSSSSTAWEELLWHWTALIFGGGIGGTAFYLIAWYAPRDDLTV